MKVYTKRGDGGATYSLKNKTIISKGESEFEFYGKLDKVLAFIGLLYSNVRDRGILNDLDKIILELHNIYTTFTSSSRFNSNITNYLEKRIDAFSKNLEMNDFLMETFTSSNAALANICRVMVRELEREAVRQGIEKDVLPFLNRLSDYFFMLALFWEKNQKTYKDLLTNKNY